MGILSRIFKKKVEKIVDTPIGPFTLTYSRGNKHIWVNSSSDILFSVRGTTDSPNAEQLKFLTNIENKVAVLNEQITKKFKIEFSDAGLSNNFKTWKDRFGLVSIEVIAILEEADLWSITFEDKESPYAHYSIFIEDDSINSDFSIET